MLLETENAYPLEQEALLQCLGDEELQVRTLNSSIIELINLFVKQGAESCPSLCQCSVRFPYLFRDSAGREPGCFDSCFSVVMFSFSAFNLFHAF